MIPKYWILDYMGAMIVSNSDEQTKTMSEMERVINILVDPEVEKTYRSICDTQKPIPQHVVFPWMFSTVIRDPLLNRLNTINSNAETGIDSALMSAKRFAFDDVLPKIETVLNDSSLTPLTQCEALLLGSRFAFYHNLRDKSREMINKFGDLWSTLDEETQRTSIDLRVGYMVMLIRLAGNHSIAEEQARKAMALDPTNVDPLVSKILVTHPHI